jgi:RNA polymerase sigma-70 factor, ECF subfamily
MATRTKQGSQLDDPADWVDRYGDVMLNYALARVGKREVAEDLVQESFLAAWRGHDTFDEKSQRGTWLIGILRRKIADYFRADGRAPTKIPIDQAPAEGTLFDARGKWIHPPQRWKRTPDEAAEAAEFWRVLAQCMSDMPSHLAKAFQLREIGRTENTEICRLEGITPKNLSVRLHRARLLLRQCLERNWFCTDEAGG